MTSTVRTLLADDDPACLEDLSDSLLFQTHLPHRFQVIGQAQTGAEALGVARQSYPQLAILDLEMPEGNGIEVAKKLRYLNPPPKVIIFSCHLDRVDMYSALEAGIRGYVLKGCLVSLLKAIESILAGGIWFDPFVMHQMYKKALNDVQFTWKQPLTTREREVLTAFSKGLSQSAIGAEINIGTQTVKTHLEHIRIKAACATLSELRLKLLKFSI